MFPQYFAIAFLFLFPLRLAYVAGELRKKIVRIKLYRESSSWEKRWFWAVVTAARWSFFVAVGACIGHAYL